MSAQRIIHRLFLDTARLIDDMGRGRVAPVILLVEDNPDDVLLTKRAFAKHKLRNELVVAHDGQEALDYLFGTGSYSERDTTALPEVIMLDLQLPKVSGLDVLRRIRSDERTKLQPVVILTSSNEEQDVVSGYRLGANSYVRKPVDFSQFLEAARYLGVYWLVLNQTVTRTR